MILDQKLREAGLDLIDARELASHLEELDQRDRLIDPSFIAPYRLAN
jgi:hypothetical protein